MLSFLSRVAIGMAISATLPAAAMAQANWTPGSEVVGQPIQVTTNGVTNTVYLDPVASFGSSRPAAIRFLEPGLLQTANCA